MHTVIANAARADPYPIEVLFLYMANMSWNSAMNTRETMQWLTDKDDAGGYRIPRIIYSDAYASEMVAYADIGYLSRLVDEEFAVSGVQLVLDRRRPQRSAFFAELKRLPSLEAFTDREGLYANLRGTLIGAIRGGTGVLIAAAGLILFGTALNASLVSLAERRRDVVRERRGAERARRDDLIQLATFADRIVLKTLVGRSSARERKQLRALRKARRE